MMTLEEARNNIGFGVVYDPGHGGAREDGVIIRVTHLWVMVRYDGNGVKATHPRDLTLLSDPA